MKFYFLLTLLLTQLMSLGQEHDLYPVHRHKKHSVGGTLSMTNIPIADPEGDMLTVWSPTIGIEYGYRLNETWDIGINSDIELIPYRLEGQGEDPLERENVWVTILAFSYHPNEHIRMFGGPGIEIEKHKNFFVTTIGFGYHVSKNNIVAMPFLKVDLKGVYYSTAIGIAVGLGL